MMDRESSGFQGTAAPGRGHGLWEPAAHVFPTERLDEFLLWAADKGATDIAFSTGLPAFMEVDGRLSHATGAALDGPAMARVAGALHVSRERAETELRGGGAIDCSHTARGPGRRRFRVNMLPLQTRGRWGMGLSLRVLPEDIPDLDALGIEAEIVDALQLGAGICLVTGLPGSGKSTILAAAMRRLLERGLGKVQTFESPIEFPLDGVKAEAAFIEQTEVPTHVGSFAEGLRAALRRRPAAVMVGEARDRETIEAVVNAADYGIAVYATAHVVGVAAAIRRLLTAFPPNERAERAVALLDGLTLVVTQMLVPNPQGGRTALREWLVFDGDLKRRLFAMPRESWPRAIGAAVKARSLGKAALRAHGEGRIGDGDLARALAASAGRESGADSDADSGPGLVDRPGRTP